MSNPYLNSEQNDYVDYLHSLPLTEKCWCGWNRLGKCYNCPADKTCADKVAAQCPECHNDGGPEGKPITHRIGCSKREAKNAEIQSSEQA